MNERLNVFLNILDELNFDRKRAKGIAYEHFYSLQLMRNSKKHFYNLNLRITELKPRTKLRSKELCLTMNTSDIHSCYE